MMKSIIISELQALSLCGTQIDGLKILRADQTAGGSQIFGFQGHGGGILHNQVRRSQTAGKICGEFVMCYPPGIPILAPGEMITPEIIEYIIYAKEKGCSMQGTEDPAVEHLNVLVDDRQVWK